MSNILCQVYMCTYVFVLANKGQPRHGTNKLFVTDYMSEISLNILKRVHNFATPQNFTTQGKKHCTLLAAALHV